MSPPSPFRLPSKPLEYEPLASRQIRLVHVQRRESNNQLTCSFRHVNVDHLPVKYIVVSAGWVVLFVIQRSVFQTDKRFFTWAANIKIVTYFWIDFLCVNEDDIQNYLRNFPHFGSRAREHRDFAVVRILTANSFDYFDEKDLILRNEFMQFKALFL